MSQMANEMRAAGVPAAFRYVLPDAPFPDPLNPSPNEREIPLGTYVVHGKKSLKPLTFQHARDCYVLRPELFPDANHNRNPNTNEDVNDFLAELTRNRNALKDYGKDVVKRYRVWRAANTHGWTLPQGAQPTSERDLITCYCQNCE